MEKSKVYFTSFKATGNDRESVFTALIAVFPKHCSLLKSSVI